MSARKVTANSQAKALATTKVIWNIEGWNGSLQKLIRSQASCLVSVGDSPAEKVDLRFYLRQFDCADNPEFDPDLPVCRSTSKCSGYSLMVDVLSEHKNKLMFTVTADMLKQDDSELEFSKKHDVVVLAPNSRKTDVTAIKVFYRSETWNEDWEGNVDNYWFYEMEEDDEESKANFHPNIKFSLTVTTYKMENTGSDNQNVEMLDKTEKESTEFESKHDESSKYCDVVLTSQNGEWIRAYKSILAAKSPYLRRLLAEKTGHSREINLRVNVPSRPLLALVSWMNTGNLTSTNHSFLLDLCEAAMKLEMISFFEAEMVKLQTVLSPDKIEEVMEFIKTYKRNTTSDKYRVSSNHASDADGLTDDPDTQPLLAQHQQTFNNPAIVFSNAINGNGRRQSADNRDSSSPDSFEFVNQSGQPHDAQYSQDLHKLQEDLTDLLGRFHMLKK